MVLSASSSGLETFFSTVSDRRPAGPWSRSPPGTRRSASGRRRCAGRSEAEDHQRQQQHAGEDGALDEGADGAHGGAPGRWAGYSRTRTLARRPARRRPTRHQVAVGHAGDHPHGAGEIAPLHLAPLGGVGHHRPDEALPLLLPDGLGRQEHAGRARDAPQPHVHDGAGRSSLKSARPDRLAPPRAAPASTAEPMPDLGPERLAGGADVASRTSPGPAGPPPPREPRPTRSWPRRACQDLGGRRHRDVLAGALLPGGDHAVERARTVFLASWSSAAPPPRRPAAPPRPPAARPAAVLQRGGEAASPFTSCSTGAGRLDGAEGRLGHRARGLGLLHLDAGRRRRAPSAPRLPHPQPTSTAKRRMRPRPRRRRPPRGGPAARRWRSSAARRRWPDHLDAHGGDSPARGREGGPAGLAAGGQGQGGGRAVRGSWSSCVVLRRVRAGGGRAQGWRPPRAVQEDSTSRAARRVGRGRRRAPQAAPSSAPAEEQQRASRAAAQLAFPASARNRSARRSSTAVSRARRPRRPSRRSAAARRAARHQRQLALHQQLQPLAKERPAAPGRRRWQHRPNTRRTARRRCVLVWK